MMWFGTNSKPTYRYLDFFFSFLSVVINSLVLLLFSCFIPLCLQIKGVRLFTNALENHENYYGKERPPIYSYFVADPLHYSDVSFERGHNNSGDPKPGHLEDLLRITAVYSDAGFYYFKMSYLVAIITSILRLRIKFTKLFIELNFNTSALHIIVIFSSFILALFSIATTYTHIKLKGNAHLLYMEENFHQFFLLLVVVTTTQTTIVTCIVIPGIFSIFKAWYGGNQKLSLGVRGMRETQLRIFAYLLLSFICLFSGVIIHHSLMSKRDGNFIADTYQEAIVFAQIWILFFYISLSLFKFFVLILTHYVKKKVNKGILPVRFNKDKIDLRKYFSDGRYFIPIGCSETLSELKHTRSGSKDNLIYPNKSKGKLTFGVFRKGIKSFKRLSVLIASNKIYLFLLLVFMLLLILFPLKGYMILGMPIKKSSTCFTSLTNQKKSYKKSIWSVFSPFYYFFSSYPFSAKQETYRRQVNLLSTATGKSFDVCSESFVNNETIVGVKYPEGHSFSNILDYFSLLPRRFLNYFTGTESCSEWSPNNIANDLTIESNDIAYKTSAPVVGSIFHDRGHKSSCISSHAELDKIREARNLLDVEDYMSDLPYKDLLVDKEGKENGDTMVFIPPERRRRFPREGRRYSDYDSHTHELLVAARCPGGLKKSSSSSSSSSVNNTPIVIVEDLFRNQFGHDFETIMPFFPHRPVTASPKSNTFSPNSLGKTLEEKYGRDLCDEVLLDKHGTTISHSVINTPPKPCIVYRMVKSDLFEESDNDKQSTTIIRVEQRVRELYPLIPAQHAPEEAIANPIYPRPTLHQKNKTEIFISAIPTLPVDHYRIPLMSETVSILCPQLREYSIIDSFSSSEKPYLNFLNRIQSVEEEYHVHPLPTPLQGECSQDFQDEDCQGVPDDLKHIPSILWMITDSASRQDLLRNLPRVASWLRHHEDTNDISVTDMKGASTIGPGTFSNLVGAWTGIPDYSDLTDKESQSIFKLLKDKYGRKIFLGMASAMCDYNTNVLVSTQNFKDFYDKKKSDDQKNGPFYPYQLPPVFGGGASYMDKEIDGAFCHLHDTENFGYRKGHNSIWKRCMGGALHSGIKKNYMNEKEKKSFLRKIAHFFLRKTNPLQNLPPSWGLSNESNYIGGGRHVHDYNFEYLEEGIMMGLAVVRGKYHPERFNKTSINLHVRSLYRDIKQSRLLNNYKRFLQIGYFYESHEQTHSVLNQIDLSYYRFLRKLEIVYNYFEPNDPTQKDNRNIMLLISDHGAHRSLYNTRFPLVERNLPYIVLVGNVTREERNNIYSSEVQQYSASGGQQQRQLQLQNVTPKCNAQLSYQRLHRYTSRGSTHDIYSEKEALSAASVSMTTYIDLYHTLCDLMNVECGRSDDIYSQEKYRSISPRLFSDLVNSSEFEHYLVLYNEANKYASQPTLNKSVRGRFSSYLDPIWINSRKLGMSRNSCHDVNVTEYCYKIYCGAE